MGGLDSSVLLPREVFPPAPCKAAGGWISRGDDGTACDGTMETTDGFEEGNDLTWCTLSCSAWGLGMCGADCDSGDLRGVEGDLRGVGGLDTAAAVTVAVTMMLVGMATLGVLKTEAGEEGSDVTMATVFEMALAVTLDCLSFIGWSSGGGLVGVGTLKEVHLGEGVGTGLNSSGTMAGHDGEEGTGEGRGLDTSEEEEGRSRGGGLGCSGLAISELDLGWPCSLGTEGSLESGVFGSGLTNSGMGTVRPPKRRTFLVASGDAGEVVGKGCVVVVWGGGDRGGSGGGGERGGGIGGRGGDGGKDWKGEGRDEGGRGR